jgi:uncharacterized Zn finger protein (UPF0148 family)
MEKKKNLPKYNKLNQFPNHQNTENIQNIAGKKKEEEEEEERRHAHKQTDKQISHKIRYVTDQPSLGVTPPKPKFKLHELSNRRRYKNTKRENKKSRLPRKVIVRAGERGKEKVLRSGVP